MRSPTGARRLAHVLLTTVAICALPVSADADTSAPAPDVAAVEAYVRERTAATATPGTAYAIVTPSEVEHIGTWGRDGDGRPVTATTPFLWGSVSKPVTASAVMTLVEAGEVDLDEPVRTYLPDFALADAGTSARITVRDLLRQTSGLPERTGVTDQFEPRADAFGEAVAALSDVAPVADPGDDHEYSSANYLVLGALVQAVSGRPYATYLREHVLAPLDMSGVVATARRARADLPPGHGYAFGHVIETEVHYDAAGASYGYLGGTIEDLAHFAMAQLNAGAYGSGRILAPDTVDQMQHGTARVNDRQAYGLGWRDDARNDDLGTRTVWHGGAAPGYQATVVLLPEAGYGIVVLQNVYGFFQDAELVGTGLGAARLVAGGRPDGPQGDGTYPVLLAGLCVVLVAVVVGVGWSLRRALRWMDDDRRPGGGLAGTTAGIVGGLGLAYVAGVLVPRAGGSDLRVVRLYAPDVGWLLLAITTASLTFAAVQLIGGCVRVRRVERDRRGSR